MCELCLFFFHYTATTEIYTYGHTLSLHDALPICDSVVSAAKPGAPTQAEGLYGFSCGKAPPKEGLVDSGWFLQLLVKGRGGRSHRAGGALATTVYFEPPVLLDHGGSVSAADKHSESSVSKAAEIGRAHGCTTI